MKSDVFAIRSSLGLKSTSTLPLGGSDANAAGEGELPHLLCDATSVNAALPARSSRPSQWEGEVRFARPTACVALFLVMFLTLGCAQPESTQNESSPKTKVATTKIERGPVIVTVEVSPEPARLSDEPTLTLSVNHEDGVEVKMPPFGETVGDFIIRDFHEPLPLAREGRQLVRQIYTLEPTTTGALQIDPISITFTDGRANGDGEQHTVETEALKINILSVVDSEAPSLDDLEGFAAPVDLPPSRAWVGWTVGGAAAFGVAIVAIVLIMGRRKVMADVKQLTPRELANQELDRLWNDNASREDVKVFYVRLTAIIRNYIEGTTGVHAPEQTTEEFLHEIGTGDVFSRDECDRLKDFLESADLVKFARALPQSSDIQQSFDRARRFVDTVKEEAAA